MLVSNIITSPMSPDTATEFPILLALRWSGAFCRLYPSGEPEQPEDGGETEEEVEMGKGRPFVWHQQEMLVMDDHG